MSAVTVDGSDLKSEGGEELNRLLDYLTARLGVAAVRSGNRLTMSPSEGQELRVRDVKERVKRFLYSRGLRPRYRVTASGSVVTVRKTAKS